MYPLPFVRPKPTGAADPERGESPRSSLAAEEPARKKARFHFEKCTPCRRAKKKCVPVARQWPEYCDRCKAKNVICTPNARSEGRPWSTPTAIAPTLTSDHNGSVEEDTADDQESGEKRNRDSSTATTRTRENFGTFEAQGHLEITTSRSEDRSQNQRSESSETHPDRISTAHPGISHVDSTAKPNSRLASTSDVNDGSSYFTDLSLKLSWARRQLGYLAEARRIYQLLKGDSNTKSTVQAFEELEAVTTVAISRFVDEVDRFCINALNGKNPAERIASQGSEGQPPDKSVSLVTKYSQSRWLKAQRLISERHGRSTFIMAPENRSRKLISAYAKRLADIGDISAAINIQRGLLLSHPSPETDNFSDECSQYAKFHQRHARRLRETSQIEIQEGPFSHEVELMVKVFSAGKDLWLKFFKQDYLDPLKRTALHIAIEAGRSEIIDALCSNGVLLDCADIFGRTPFHIACAKRDIALAKRLIEHGADINAHTGFKRTALPLHLAAQQSEAVYTELLLEKGARLNVRNAEGETPLHIATRANNTEVMRVLLRKGANPDGMMKEMHRVMKGPAAAKIGGEEEDGASDSTAVGGEDIEMAGTDGISGITPLQYASQSGFEGAVKILIQSTMNLDLGAGSTLGTALHCATKARNAAIVKLLLDHEVDVNAEDKNGRTALRLAQSYKYWEIEALLRARLNSLADISSQRQLNENNDEESDDD